MSSRGFVGFLYLKLREFKREVGPSLDEFPELSEVLRLGSDCREILRPDVFTPASHSVCVADLVKRTFLFFRVPVLAAHRAGTHRAEFHQPFLDAGDFLFDFQCFC